MVALKINSVYLPICLRSKSSNFPGLFVGDSRLDHQVATQFGLDFIFLSKWTDYQDWQQYCESNKILAVPAISDILKFGNKTNLS